MYFHSAETNRRHRYGTCNVDALNEAIYKSCKEGCTAWICQSHVGKVSIDFSAPKKHNLSSRHQHFMLLAMS